MASNINSKTQLEIDSQIIKRKSFLKHIYLDFYKSIIPNNIPPGPVVELGSGGGFIKEVIPNIITSDIIKGVEIDKVFPAEKIPFKKNSVSAFLMIGVLHHIKNSEKALSEMERCLKIGGKIIMIEPYNTCWGEFIFKYIHPERFDPKASWRISGKGRLSDSNTALPWIIFNRDRERFEKKFPRLKILLIEPFMPFSYLFSGGLSKYQFLPAFTYPLIKALEKAVSPLNRLLGMFALIKLEKI